MALQWALALSLIAGVLAQQTAEENCAQSIDGGRWTLVRHTYNIWFQATDGLTGTASYGDSSEGPLSPNQWAIPFDAEDSTEFLFSDGDCDRWMITTYDQFAYQWGSNYDATILKSHISDTPYIAKWYNRGNQEDPWISYQDHWDNNRLTNMYGENGVTGNAAYADSHMNVWMRSDATDSPTKGPTSSPTKTPTAEPSPEPTADPVRDCDVLHIDEFLVDCSVEFEGHDNDIDSLKSDVTTLKDNLVNSTSAMAAAIQVLKNAVEESRWGQYVPVLEEKSWEDANEHCQSKYGTTLATIRSKLDAEAMMQMTQYYRYRTGGDSYPTDRWWIGLNDIERGGIDFKWASGYEGSWSSMLSWSNQDPCVHFAKGGEMTEPTIANGITLPDKFIYPYRCHFRWYFVCDAPLTFASDDLASAIASAATEIADADDFSDGLEPADSMVELNGTNMMIAGLVIANVVTMIVLAVVCCGNGSSDKHRYGVVGVGSD